MTVMDKDYQNSLWLVVMQLLRHGIKNSTKQKIEMIYKLFIGNGNSPLKKIQIEESLKEKVPYGLLNKLEKYNILSSHGKSKRKMLTDNGISDEPAYSREEIHDMKQKNISALMEDVNTRLEVAKIYFEIVWEWGSLSLDDRKLYNQIVDRIKEKQLYDINYGYWILDWRPQSVAQYYLNLKVLEAFLPSSIYKTLKAPIEAFVKSIDKIE